MSNDKSSSNNNSRPQSTPNPSQGRPLRKSENPPSPTPQPSKGRPLREDNNKK